MTFRSHRFRRIITSVLGCGFGLAVVFILALRVEHGLPLTLPEPTGPFAVGRTFQEWQGVREGAASQGSSQNEPLQTWIWYPATKARMNGTEPYLPEQIANGIMRARPFVMARLLTRDLTKVRTHARTGANLAGTAERFPVVLMRGGASAEVWNYSVLAEDLASHGYIVIGFDVPYRTNVVIEADGSVIRRRPENNPEVGTDVERLTRVNRLLGQWNADLRFALDQLELLNASDAMFRGRIDVEHVGAFGHSFGGAQAARLCETDARCRAAADLDGALWGDSQAGEIHQPFLFLLSDHRGERGAEARAILADIRATHRRLPTRSPEVMYIAGANHFFFSDDSALLKSHLLIGALHLLGGVHLSGEEQLADTAYCLRTFFDAEFSTPTSTALMLTSPQHPNVRALE